MSGPAMIAHMLLERLSRRELPRIPEPDLVMEDRDQIEAFAASGREDGVLAPIYFFHALHATITIQPGDTVLDLACGPCNQLVQMAQLHPQAHFIGIDASRNMLDLGEATLRGRGIHNVSLQQADVRSLDGIASGSINSVTCTLSLHHLPDEAALMQTMQAARRVLKPGGGVYLADFGRFKRRATQYYFAHDRQDCQVPQFTADFLNSMKAAFSVKELNAAIALLGDDIQRHATILAPFMVVFRRAVTNVPAPGTQAQARNLFYRMTPAQQQDFHDLAKWFQTAGLKSPFVL